MTRKKRGSSFEKAGKGKTQIAEQRVTREKGIKTKEGKMQKKRLYNEKQEKKQRKIVNNKGSRREKLEKVQKSTTEILHD